MQAYVDPEDTSTADWMFSLAFAQDQARYAFPIAPMQPCGNPACGHSSYALFCCESCRVRIETADEPEPAEDAYYSDGAGVLLGHRQLSDDQHFADQAAGGFAALVCGVQPQAAPVAVPALPESPCSVNTYVELAGRQVQVTLRGVDEAEVLARLEALLQRFPVALPAPAAQSTPEAPGAGWCAIHQVQMRDNEKDGRHWYSHRVDDGFCKGRQSSWHARAAVRS